MKERKTDYYSHDWQDHLVHAGLFSDNCRMQMWTDHGDELILLLPFYLFSPALARFLQFPFLYKLHFSIDSSLKQACPSALIQRLCVLQIFLANIPKPEVGLLMAQRSWSISELSIEQFLSGSFLRHPVNGRASKDCVWEGWCADKSESKNKNCIEVQAQKNLN